MSLIRAALSASGLSERTALIAGPRRFDRGDPVDVDPGQLKAGQLSGVEQLLELSRRGRLEIRHGRPSLWRQYRQRHEHREYRRPAHHFAPPSPIAPPRGNATRGCGALHRQIESALRRRGSLGYVWPVDTRMPAATGVTQARTTTPSTTTRHSWQTPIPQNSPRGVARRRVAQHGPAGRQQHGAQALARRRHQRRAVDDDLDHDAASSTGAKRSGREPGQRDDRVACPCTRPRRARPWRARGRCRRPRGRWRRRCSARRANGPMIGMWSGVSGRSPA